MRAPPAVNSPPREKSQWPAKYAARRKTWAETKTEGQQKTPRLGGVKRICKGLISTISPAAARRAIARRTTAPDPHPSSIGHQRKWARQDAQIRTLLSATKLRQAPQRQALLAWCPATKRISPTSVPSGQNSSRHSPSTSMARPPRFVRRARSIRAEPPGWITSRTSVRADATGAGERTSGSTTGGTDVDWFRRTTPPPTPDGT